MAIWPLTFLKHTVCSCSLSHHDWNARMQLCKFASPWYVIKATVTLNWPRLPSISRKCQLVSSAADLEVRLLCSKIRPNVVIDRRVRQKHRWAISLCFSSAQWLKWFCEAGGGGSPDEARLSKPHTHSNPTNLALYRRKITLHRFNQGLILLQGAQMGAGANPPDPRHFNYWFRKIDMRAKKWRQKFVVAAI